MLKMKTAAISISLGLLATSLFARDFTSHLGQAFTGDLSTVKFTQGYQLTDINGDQLHDLSWISDNGTLNYVLGDSTTPKNFTTSIGQAYTGNLTSIQFPRGYQLGDINGDTITDLSWISYNGTLNYVLSLGEGSTALSCKDILDNGRSVGDGTYQIDPDGEGEGAPFDVYCDMTKDGGGWTYLVHHVSQSNRTNDFWSNSPAYYTEPGFTLGSYDDMSSDFLSQGFSSMPAEEVMVVRLANQAYATRTLNTENAGKNLMELMGEKAISNDNLYFGQIIAGTQAEIIIELTPGETESMFGAAYPGTLRFLAYDRGRSTDIWQIEQGPLVGIADNGLEEYCTASGWTFAVRHSNNRNMDICRATAKGDAIILGIR